MSKLSEVRLKVRGELEVPPALRRFGSGWISGVLGLVLGLAGLALVVSLMAPGFLGVPELQGLRANPWYRAGVHAILLAGFFLSLLSLGLRRDRTLGTCGAVLALLASLIGGSETTAIVAGRGFLFLGLDFFVLRVLFTGMLFIPIERAFAQRGEQPVFREEWREDLFYYLVSSLLVQILTLSRFFRQNQFSPS